MLIDASRSTLLLVDLQAKVLPAVDGADVVVANAVWLLRAAQKIGVPVAAVEHHAKGLGPLIPEVRDLLPAGAVASKQHFSAVAQQCLPGLPGGDRVQYVIAGVETHVCVLQTALDLVADGKDVFVVGDAVGSRRPYDRDVALARMRDEGVRVVTREMVVFEWLEDSTSQLFRDVHQEFLR
ncbi:MAG TPA: isochorismatase family protein [Casimicrobiaceae bacterium]|nr:isochorismatase family protein [Casimicrobiaceae bacterium]